MPKWQINVIRDTSRDAEVVVEAETVKEAEQIFLHDRIATRSIGERVTGSATPKSLRSTRTRKSRRSMGLRRSRGLMSPTSPARSIGSLRTSTPAILDPKDVLTLRGIAEQLDVIAREPSTS
jgi:hypothetical protein